MPKHVRSFVCSAMEYIQQNKTLIRKQLAFHAGLIWWRDRRIQYLKKNLDIGSSVHVNTGFPGKGFPF